MSKALYFIENKEREKYVGGWMKEDEQKPASTSEESFEAVQGDPSDCVF